MRVTNWLLVCLMLTSCRDKDNGCEECGQLSPPYGVIASATDGELAFFDLMNLQVIRNASMPGWATACEILPIGGTLIATDNDVGALSLFTLPEVDRFEQVDIAGTPVDLRVAQNSLTAHLLTHNSRYYRISFADFEVDTVETGLDPRRLKLRPGDQWTWIACPGDCTVRAIKEQGFFEDFRIEFNGPCTDIEFSPDGALAYCALPSSDQLMIIDASDGEIVDSLLMFGSVIDLGISDDGRFLMAVDSTRGDARVYDIFGGEFHSLRCGTSASRVRYSETSEAFFVVCPRQNMVVRVDPEASPPVITDSIIVEPIPQCLSFLE